MENGDTQLSNCNDDDNDIQLNDSGDSEDVNAQDDNQLDNGDDGGDGDDGDGDDEDDGGDEASEEEVTYFKKSVQNYLKLLEEVKALNNAVKQRRDKIKKISEVIATFITEKDISHINLHGSFTGKRMEYVTKESKKSLSEDNIVEQLRTEFNIDDVEKIMKLINKSRISVNKQKLAIVSPKNSKKTKSELLEEVVQTSTVNEIPNHMSYLYNS